MTPLLIQSFYFYFLNHGFGATGRGRISKCMGRQPPRLAGDAAPAATAASATDLPIPGGASILPRLHIHPPRPWWLESPRQYHGVRQQNVVVVCWRVRVAELVAAPSHCLRPWLRVLQRLGLKSREGAVVLHLHHRRPCQHRQVLSY